MYNTCLPNIKTRSVFGSTGCSEIWFLKKSEGSLNKVAARIECDKTTKCDVWPNFHVHVEIIWHGQNLFLYSPDMLSTILCFPFAFSHYANVTDNFSGSCYWSILQQFPWFPFNKFWGQERRTFYSFEHFLALLPHPIVSFGPHFLWK